MTPAHDELRHDAAAYALGVLDPGERAAFETHLAGCAECAAEVREMRQGTPFGNVLFRVTRENVVL